MTIILWIFPLLFYFGSSFVLNQKKLNLPLKSLLFRSFLETMFSYLLSMIFITRLFYNQAWIIFVFLGLLLADGFILFWRSKVGENDFDIEIETIKNNLILFCSSVLPFILFMVVFREFPWYLKASLSLLISGAVFTVSYFLKKWLSPLYDKIQIRIQMTTDVNLGILFFVFAGLLVLFVGVFSVAVAFQKPNLVAEYENFTFLPEGMSGEVIDYHYLSNELLYLYTSSQELSNEQVIVYELEEGETLYSTDIQYLDSTVENRLSKYPNFIQFGNQLVLLPSYGAYNVSSTSVAIIEHTEGYPIFYFEQEDDVFLLIDHGDDTYEIMNESLQISSAVDLTDTGQKLSVITNTLFLQDAIQYTLYYNQAVSFENVGGSVSFDSQLLVLFSLTPDTSNESITFRKETSEGVIVTHAQKTEPGKEYVNLFNLLYTNSTEVFNPIHQKDIDDDLSVTSVYFDKEWISVLAYNPDKFILKQLDGNSENTLYMNTEINRSSLVLMLGKVIGFESGVDPKVFVFIESIISALVIISFFFPYSNYRATITVVDFDTPFKKGREYMDAYNEGKNMADPKRHG